MKKLISITKNELLRLCKDIFKCDTDTHLEEEIIDGESIATDYIVLSPTEGEFNNTIIMVSELTGLDSIDIKDMDGNKILVDFTSLTSLIEQTYNVTTTGWYDIDFCEALGGQEELILFEIK